MEKLLWRCLQYALVSPGRKAQLDWLNQLYSWVVKAVYVNLPVGRYIIHHSAFTNTFSTRPTQKHARRMDPVENIRVRTVTAQNL